MLLLPLEWDYSLIVFEKPADKAIYLQNKPDREKTGLVKPDIENDKGEFLIQKTSEEKGGRYSSTGGHINHGEDTLSTIKREVLEEVGVDISNENIISLGHICVDFPLRFIFYLKKNLDIDSFILQKEKVESISYMSVKTIKKLLDDD